MKSFYNPRARLHIRKSEKADKEGYGDITKQFLFIFDRKMDCDPSAELP